MYKLLCVCCIMLGFGQVSGQNCTNLNFPTAIADSCHLSPFLCGNYLADYCGSNVGLTDDAFGLNSGFLGLSPCESDLSLQVNVTNCAPGGNALIFSLFPDSCNANLLLAADTVFQNTTDTLMVQNLEALENYLLAISGLQGSQCEFNIQVLEGIGTALPGPADCSCTGGGIDGPKQVCSNDPITFNLTVPSCFLGFSPPVGGNGEFCPPASACPGSLDSFVLVWHIPSIMHFIGDSTGLSVQIALDTSYHGLDTIRLDSIWVSWQLISTEPVDTLNFCACSNVSCAGGLFTFHFSIGIKKLFYSCTLTCSDPSCTIDGITYTAPGFYTYEPEACTTVAVTINQITDMPLVPGAVICEGGSTVLSVINFDPEFFYQWSNGATGPSISVSPSVTTQYFVTAIHFLGNCIFTMPVTVTVIPSINENLGQVGVITCLQPCVVFQGTTYCVPGNYTKQTGQCSTQMFSIGSDPSLFQSNLPPVTICEGDCYDFFGQPICSDSIATHIENCTLYVQQIIVGPFLNTDLGVVGAVTCSQPCFTYDGITYCDPGEYTVPNGQCATKKFKIVFEKEIINLGMVGELTCAQNCVTYNGIEYCQPGTYTLTDSCTIRNFSIEENLDLPVYSSPIFDCLPSNTHFTVAFSISGIPPYKVNGDAISGSYFLSNPQGNSVPFSFIIEQANGCQTIVSGLYDCAQFCLTNAGGLSGSTLHGCAGQTLVQAQTTLAPSLAPGDVENYVLQDEDGQVIARNPVGVFGFDPSTMTLGETYFMLRSVGPPDANGFPDWANTCTDSSNAQPVVFHPIPEVSLQGDSSLCEGNMLTLTAMGAVSYLWNDGATGDTKIIQSVETTNEGLYSVVGSNEFGCKDADSVEVVVRPEQSEGCCRPQLPNAFTPNGDGANDSFIPILPDCNQLEFAEMRIYSRWGELVFKSLKKDDRWDGNTPNGLPASSDTYVFTFRYRLIGDEERTQKGEVTLLR